MPCRAPAFASPKQACFPALSFPLTFRGRRQVVAFADELFGVSDSSRGSCHLQRWRRQTVKCAKRAVGAPGGERGLGLSDGIARAQSVLCHASAPVAHAVSPMTAGRGRGTPERAAPAPFCAPVLTPVATPGPWRHLRPDSSRADHGIALMPLPTTSSQHQAPDKDWGQPPACKTAGRASCTTGAPGAIDATLQSCQTATAAGDENGESAAALAGLAAPPASLGTAADLSLAPSSNDGSGGMGCEGKMQSLAPLPRAPSEGGNGVSSDLVGCHDPCKRTTSRAHGAQETLKSNALRVRR